MKKILAVMLSFVMIVLLSGCGSGIAYEDADILSFEIGKLTKQEYSDFLEGKIKIKNNSDFDISYCDINIAFYDDKGDLLYEDSRYNDIPISPGKSIDITTYCEKDIKKVDEVVVYAYEYQLVDKDSMGNNNYTINCQTKEVEGYYTEPLIEDEVKYSFDDVNILDFDMGEFIDSEFDDSISVDVKITNKSSIKVAECDYNVAYYDKDDNAISDDSRYKDIPIAPGKHVKSTTFCDEGKKVRKAEIYSYTYTLVEPDRFGNKSYNVNIQTKEVTASDD